jgi:hypothetical protein
VIFDPTSRVLLSVNEPVRDPTFVPSQNSTASVLIVALLPAAERLPPAVASEVVPLPVGSSPLLPGPAAATDPTLGPSIARASIEATAIHPRRRNGAVRERVLGRFIDRIPIAVVR